MYRLTEATAVVLLDTGERFIPDSASDGWEKYQEWLGKGNKPLPPPLPVPQKVTKFQGKAALLNAGKLDVVEAAMKTASPITQLAWAEAQSFVRDSPMIVDMGKQLGFIDKQIDDLFIYAASVN